jgi:hypothetical protein
MSNYILSRATARTMISTWHSLNLSLNDFAGIHSACGMHTVFNPLASGTMVSLTELQPGDQVTLCLTPGHEIEQEDLVPYGHLLKHIIDVASGPTATPPDDLPEFFIVYE